MVAGSGEKFRLGSHITVASPSNCLFSGQDKVTDSPIP